MSIHIDIGSTNTKVSVMLGDQKVHVQGAIVPAFFVHKDLFLTGISFDECLTHAA